MTQKCKRLSRLFFCLSWLLTVCPVLVYLVRAFVIGLPHQKLTLGCMVVVAGILTAISVMNKVVIRSTKWILILGIYAAIREILPLLIMIAVFTIIDEFIIGPLHRHYKLKYKINKEMDDRGI